MVRKSSGHHMNVNSLKATAKSSKPRLDDPKSNSNKGDDPASEVDLPTGLKMTIGSGPQLTVGELLLGRFLVTHATRHILPAYGQLVFGIDRKTRGGIVIKCEPHRCAAHCLPAELRCLQVIADSQRLNAKMPNEPINRHFVRLLAHSVITARELSYIVMERCQSDLYALRKQQPGERFSAGTTLRCMLQTLYALRALHELNFIHRDIKPHNLCTCLLPNDPIPVIKLIDFGTARQYRKGSGMVTERPHCSVAVGTTRYNSMRAHEHKDKCRACDIWGVLYVAMEMLQPDLPWRSLVTEPALLASKKNSNYESVLGARISAQVGSLLRLREQLSGVGFYDEPDYNRIITGVMCDMAALGVTSRTPFDWVFDSSM